MSSPLFRIQQNQSSLEYKSSLAQYKMSIEMYFNPPKIFQMKKYLYKFLTEIS